MGGAIGVEVHNAPIGLSGKADIIRERSIPVRSFSLPKADFTSNYPCESLAVDEPGNHSGFRLIEIAGSCRQVPSQSVEIDLPGCVEIWLLVQIWVLKEHFSGPVCAL